MKKEYDAVVFIGRFQPVHNAHVEILKKAAAMASKVIVIIGSAYEPRTYKNPWVTRERTAMLEQAIIDIKKETKEGFIPVIEGNRNTIYNNLAWAVRVQDIVNKHVKPDAKVGIIGYKKDETSFYLDMFPQWETIEQPQIGNLSATQIRELYFTPSEFSLDWFTGVVPRSTVAYLSWFKDSPEFNAVVKEKEFLEKYKKQYAVLPYAPTFVTTDAVIFQAGHVLMVTRKAQPGKGLLALPGGFVNAATDRSIEDAMFRELDEETGIKVAKKILRGSIKEVKVFDAIDRSARGRTITHAFHIRLIEGEWKLPKIRAGDDAETVQWVPIGSVNSEMCFEDHYDILQYFLGKAE